MAKRIVGKDDVKNTGDFFKVSDVWHFWLGKPKLVKCQRTIALLNAGVCNYKELRYQIYQPAGCKPCIVDTMHQVKEVDQRTLTSKRRYESDADNWMLSHYKEIQTMKSLHRLQKQCDKLNGLAT